VGLGVGVVAVGGIVAWKLMSGVRKGTQVSITVQLTEDDIAVCGKAGGNMKFLGTVQSIDADKNASVLWDEMHSLNYDATMADTCKNFAGVWKREQFASGSASDVNWLSLYLGSPGVAPTHPTFKNLPAKPKVTQLTKEKY